MKTDAAAIIDRDVNPRDRVEVGVLVAEITECTKPVRVTVIPINRRRPANIAQHGYYRAVVAPLFRMWLNETQGGMDDGAGGYREFTADEAHTNAKEMTIGKPITNRDGAIISFAVPSCGQMSSLEKFQFTDMVIDLLAREGVRVPPPDKNWRDARDAAYRARSNQC